MTDPTPAASDYQPHDPMGPCKVCGDRDDHFGVAHTAVRGSAEKIERRRAAIDDQKGKTHE